MKIIRKKRKICFIITSFIHYSRSLLILDELKKRKDIELHVVVAGTALLSKYSSKHAHVKDILTKDGFKNLYELYFNLEGDEHVTKAKTAGLGIIEFSTIFNNLKPDVVTVRGDRFEILSAAVAAAYLNIPIAHIEGGDITGTIDESVRHAITKLSHIHFATTETSRKRILRMGEHGDYVFNFGSPEIEVVNKIANSGVSRAKEITGLNTGSGAKISYNGGYMMVMQHPVHSEVEKSSEQTKTLLEIIYKLNIPTIWFWPNFDAGAEQISQELRMFKDRVLDHKIHFMRYLPPRDFLWLLKNTMCLIGNSSAGIKECSFLGVPVINIGTRQQGRQRAKNVIDVDFTPSRIEKTIKKQIAVGRYPVSNLYKGQDTAKQIAKVLATIDLYVQKGFND